MADAHPWSDPTREGHLAAADERPRVGTAVLTLVNEYAALLAERTGLASQVEPVPVDRREMSLEVIPQGLRLVREQPASGPAGPAFRAELSHVVILTGKGTGALFVAEALESSLACELAFDGVLNVPLGPERYASAQLTPRSDGEGRFFEADEEAGPCLYERAWDGVLRWPLHLPYAGEAAALPVAGRGRLAQPPAQPHETPPAPPAPEPPVIASPPAPAGTDAAPLDVPPTPDPAGTPVDVDTER